MTQAGNDRRIQTRRIALEESFQDVPRHFAKDGDLLVSHLTAALTAVFPDGEDFFVRSVRRFRHEIADPELRRQVAGFIGQEAMHGREHRAFNDHLDRLGYPTKRVERFTKWGLTLRERVLSPKSNLAVTAALEHFTATLAELVLSSEETRKLFGHRAVRDLFVWHALEESEHKAVAFDVYQAVGGSERMRVVTMNGLRVGFVISLAVQMTISLLGDRATYRPGNLRRSWRTFRGSPVMSKEIWLQLRDYNRPDFHPDDSDTTELVEHWRNELFGEHGTLSDRLVTSAS
ncbi:MAG: metal-dependent hydrolase [Acidimicrobiales bacterium]|jgi:predicted metal-dependent hydrolase